MSKLLVLVLYFLATLNSVRGDCQPTAVVNFHLELPMSYLAPLSSAPQSNNVLWADYWAAIGATLSAIDMQNTALLQQNPLAFGFQPIFNQTVSFGGTCFALNFYPHYELVLYDYGTETSYAENAIQSVKACEHNSTTLPKGIALFHGSQFSEDMYDSTSVICNAYDVTVLTFLLRDKDYSRLAETPYQIRTVDLPVTANAPLLRLMNQFKWKRFAIIGSTLTAISIAMQSLQTTATAAGYELSSYVTADNTSCSDAWADIVKNDWKVIYFMPTVYEANLCLDEFHRLNLSAQNFILIFSEDFTSTVLDNWPALQTYITYPLSALSGHLVMTGNIENVYPDPKWYLPFQQFIHKYWTEYAIDTNVISETFITNYLMEQAVDVAAQGFLGMLGERLHSVKSKYQSSSTISGSMSNLVQLFVNDFLANFTVNVPLQANSVAISPSTDNVHFDVNVTWGAIGYNLKQMYYYMTNNSGLYTNSALEANLHFDQNGVHLTDMFLGSINSTTLDLFSYYSLRFNQQFDLPNFNGFTWPNPALLSSYANNWPADRNPPTYIELLCISCSSQNSALTSTSVKQAGNILFSSVPNLLSVYELDVYIDNPVVYTFNMKCDGTAPLVYSLLPYVSSLISSSQAALAPIVFNSGTGQIQVNSIQLFSQLAKVYAADPNDFRSASEMNSIPLAWLSNATNSPASIVGVLNAENNEWAINFLLTCDNTANNYSSVFKIVTHGLADVYTPSTSEQAALIAVNTFGLFVVAFIAAGVVYLRDSQVVFSSSFLFLLIILVGFSLLFVSALFSILKATDAICQAKTFCFHFGFTITLGALFAKTYRLHRIFNSRTIQLLTITNKMLVAILFLMVLVDAIIMIIWIEVSGIGIESSAKAHCYTGGIGNNIFPAIFTALKGALILIGIYFTIKVRAVPANFNESRYIAIVIYNSAVLGALYVAVFFGTSLQPNQLAIFSSIVLFVAAFLNLSVFFGSKIFAVGQTYWKSSNSSSFGSASNHSSNKFSAGKKELHSSRNSKKSKDVAEKEKDLYGEKKEQEEQESDEEDVEEKKMDRRQRARRKLQRQRVRFLQTVAFVKQREMERGRVLRRSEEIQTALSSSYDTLRALVIKLRLNSMKLQRNMHNNGVGKSIIGGSAPSAVSGGTIEDRDDIALMNDIDTLLQLPLDSLEVEDGGQTYVINQGAFTQSSRRITSMMSTGKNSKLTISTEQNNSEAAPQGGNVEMQSSPNGKTLAQHRQSVRSVQDDSQTTRPGIDQLLRGSVSTAATVAATLNTNSVTRPIVPPALARPSSITSGSANRNFAHNLMNGNGNTTPPMSNHPLSSVESGQRTQLHVEGAAIDNGSRTKSFI